MTDFKAIQDIVDKLSPYHYYQDRYWRLRGYWRNILFDWTRRDSCDVAVELDKKHYTAGAVDTLCFTYTVGEKSLKTGARIALYFPMFLGGAEHLRELAIFQGPDGQAGYGTRIRAESVMSNVLLQVNVHSVGSIFTCVEVIIEGGTLKKGESLRIIIGDTLGNKPPVISEKAQTLTFRSAVDFAGNGDFRPIKPDVIIKGRGNRAEKLNCCAPATPQAGEKFSLKVTAADNYNGNPSYDYSAELDIASQGEIDKDKNEFNVPQASHGSFEIEGFSKKSSKGVGRIILLDKENAVMGISNPICPEAAPERMSLFYGEIHAHTELSDGVGSPEDAMHWARDVENLDFSGLGDHFEKSQSYNYTREEKWEITKKIINKYNDPGKFVSLLGYEIGTLEAHRNVYFPDDLGRMIINDDNGEKVTMNNVYDKLEGTEYILIPHAPKFHGINWRAQHRPERQRLVEICSAWGVSEEGSPLSVREGLNLGLKLGFTGGTDNHSAEPGHAFYSGFGGITGAYAKELTRRGIFEALMARRTFATNGERMIINFYVNDKIMGEEINIEHDLGIYIKGRAITMSPIEGIDIIRNGKVIHTIIPGEKCDDVKIEWRDPEKPEKHIIKRKMTGENTIYYYMRVRCVGNHIGWTSPVWIDMKI